MAAADLVRSAKNLAGARAAVVSVPRVTGRFLKTVVLVDPAVTVVIAADVILAAAAMTIAVIVSILAAAVKAALRVSGSAKAVVAVAEDAINTKYRPLLFGAAVLLLFFYTAGSRPLWSTDEGRYAEIAREMWKTKNFVIPQYFSVDWLEKPVLSFFLTAVSYGIFGVNEFAARFVPALSAVLGILLTFLFVRRLFDRKTAELSAVILTTTVGYVLVGRFAVIDMLMTLWLSCALFCLMTGYFNNKRSFYLASYIFMGLGFLTKGLIGIILPLLIMGVFLLSRRNLKEIFKLQLLPGALILAAIILPWWLAAMAQKPEFFKVFILEHHFGRFTTQTFGRSKPFWFFLPVLIGACFPWSLFLPAAIRNIFKSGGEHKDKLFFLLCWLAVIFIFFSIPKSKLPYYLLPVSVPVAIICASYAHKWAMQIAAGVFVLLMVTAQVMVLVSPSQSVLEEAKVIMKERNAENKIAMFASPDDYSDLSFYLQEYPIIVGTDRGTLEQESRKKPEYASGFMKLQDFIEAFNARQEQYLLLVGEKRFKELQAKGLANYRVLSPGHRKVVLSNC